MSRPRPLVHAEDTTASPEATAWIVGRITGWQAREARVVVESASLRFELVTRDGAFRLTDLVPGWVRVELRIDRLVIARRIELREGPNPVVLRVHPTVARRLAPACDAEPGYALRERTA
jgi:hypothetical protein